MAYIRASVCSRDPSTSLTLARSKFLEFSGRRPESMQRIRCERVVPQTLVKVGDLLGLIYASDRDRRGVKRSYIHFMEAPPILACNPQGDRLYVVGGNYRVTRRGIEG